MQTQVLSTYLSARSSAAEGIKLVGTATAVTTGSRGLEARVRTELHVCSGKPAKCLLSRKTAEQEHGGKKHHSCGLSNDKGRKTTLLMYERQSNLIEIKITHIDVKQKALKTKANTPNLSQHS